MKTIMLLSILTLVLNSSSAQDYIPGLYYTHDGNRVKGLIQHVYSANFKDGPDNYILFKATADSRPKKLTTKDVRSFVINLDSFVIIKDFKINSGIYYDEDFAKIVKTGKINLYIHYTTGAARTTFGDLETRDAETYILEKDQKLIPMKNKTFNQNFKNLFADDIDLIKKIENKIFSYNDLAIVVQEFNDWYRENHL